MSGFLVHYGFPGFAALRDARADLLILANDATYRPGFGGTILTASEQAALAAMGKTTLGYVNVALTDHLRVYWNDAWVDWTNPNDRDTGPLTAAAPAWLTGGIGLIGDLPANSGETLDYNGHIVDYTHADWRQIVIAQAVAAVQAGHGGVFLDDVGLYYPTGEVAGAAVGQDFDQTKADAMMDLVVAVADAVRAVDPAAKVFVNNGVNLFTDGTIQAGPKWQAFLAAIDGMLIESAGRPRGPTDQDVLAAMAARLPGIRLMSQEKAHVTLDIEAWLGRAGTLGFEANYTENQAYQDFADAILMGTSGRDVLSLNPGGDIAAGLSGRDRMRGNSGDDMIFGHGGNDRLSGGAGDDTLSGGTGADRLHGGGGANVLTGGAGQDVFVFSDARHNRSTTLRDTITDFDSTQDRIDLRGLAPGLSFDADARSFSGVAGEVIFRPAKGALQVDLDGDGLADFRLRLDGGVRLSADDLIL